MPSNTATALYRPPKAIQPGNPSALSTAFAREDFENELQQQGGNLLRTFKALGISHMAYYRERLRDLAWAMRMDSVIEDLRRARSLALVQEADEHLFARLRDGWEWVTDPETGQPVLDDDFEPIRRSTLGVRDLVAVRQEGRHGLDGEAPHVSIQAVAQAVATAEAAIPRTPRLPVLALDDDADDAEVLDDAPSTTIVMPHGSSASQFGAVHGLSAEDDQ